MQEQKGSLREGQKMFNIPRSNLSDVPVGKIANMVFVLSSEIEKQLEDWLLKLSECGFPQSIADLQ